MTKFCPATCPVCGSDLKGDGYPIRHQHLDTGNICDFDWDTSAALQAELDEESSCGCSNPYCQA